MMEQAVGDIIAVDATPVPKDYMPNLKQGRARVSQIFGITIIVPDNPQVENSKAEIQWSSN